MKTTTAQVQHYLQQVEGGVDDWIGVCFAQQRGSDQVLVVWGPSVGHADLYALNPGYRNPGTARLSYIGQPLYESGRSLGQRLLPWASLVGGIAGLRRGDVDIRRGAMFVFGSLPGAFLGAMAGRVLS